MFFFFFFNDTATTEIYTLSLHDALPIYFCEFYGREMLRLAGPQPLTPMKGEKNYLVYIPLGVGVVIPPWNFPCAIMAGMVVASVVTGHTVVVKPSGDSPTIAAEFVAIIYEAGVPKDVV